MPSLLNGIATLPRRSTAIRPPSPPSAATFLSAAARRRSEGSADVAHARADVVADDGADERFAQPGARHRAGAVVGVGARADDRRVADAARHLAGVAAGRGRGGKVSVRSRALPRRPCRDSSSGFSASAAQPALRCGNTRAARAGVRACARSARRPSPASSTCRVFSITARAARIGLRMRCTAATAPGAQRRAVHDRGVHLDLAVAVEGGAAPGVEERRVLQHHDRRRDRVEAGSISSQQFVPASSACSQHRAMAARRACLRAARPHLRGSRLRSASRNGQTTSICSEQAGRFLTVQPTGECASAHSTISRSVCGSALPRIFTMKRTGP